MRCDSLRALEAHLEEAKASRFLPAYLVVGKESSECREAIRLLLRFLLPSVEERALGLSVCDAAQVGEAILRENLFSRSLFSTPRVVWVQEGEKLSQATQEPIERYIAHPTPFHYLLITAANCSKRPAFYSWFERGGMILELAESKPWEKEKRLIEWMGKQAAVARKQVSFHVCQALVSRVGFDRMAVEQEWEKLLCYTIEKSEITLQDLERLSPPPRAESLWQLGEAIYRRDSTGALQMAHALAVEGEAVLPLLRYLRSQFQTGYQMCLLLAEGRNTQELAQEFPHLKGQLLEKSVRQAQHYGGDAFKRGLLAIDAAYMRVKNFAMDEHWLVELLVLELTRIQKGYSV